MLAPCYFVTSLLLSKMKYVLVKDQKEDFARAHIPKLIIILNSELYKMQKGRFE
jgi:hypothetical protein